MAGFTAAPSLPIRIPSATSGRADPAVMSEARRDLSAVSTAGSKRSYVVAQGCVEDVEGGSFERVGEAGAVTGLRQSGRPRRHPACWR